MSALKEIKILKIELNTKVEDMFLKTIDRDNNIYVKRFKQFIDLDPIISKKLNSLKQIVEPIPMDEFLAPANPMNSFWLVVKPPIDENKHIVTMYDLLEKISNDEQPFKCLSSLGSRVNFSKTKNVNELARKFLIDTLEPFIDYINTFLEKEIIIMEQEKRDGITVYQTIHGDNNGVANISRDQANINMTILNDNKEDIISLIKDSIRDLEREEIKDEVKEDIIDNLEIVQEETQKETQKPRRIKRAIESINSFIENADKSIIKSASLLGNLALLATKLSELF